MEGIIGRFFLTPLMHSIIYSKVNWDEPSMRLRLFVSFFVLQILVLCGYIYMYFQMKKEDDKEKNIPTVVSYFFQQKCLKSLKEYDVDELIKHVKRLFLGSIGTGVMTYFMKDAVPLLLHIVSIPFAFIHSPLVQIFIFHENISRPFDPYTFFDQLMDSLVNARGTINKLRMPEINPEVEKANKFNRKSEVEGIELKTSSVVSENEKINKNSKSVSDKNNIRNNTRQQKKKQH